MAEEKKGIAGFFNLSEVWSYYFRKKDPNKKPSLNTRMMHGINKIALLMFLIALGVILYRYIFIY